MRFIRFVLTHRKAESGVEEGIFQLAPDLRDSPSVTDTDRHLLAEHLTWFNTHLEEPTRFNRSKAKGFYRRTTQGICWFKGTATEHLQRMHEMKGVFERNGYAVTMIVEARVGYAIYEDEHQIVAEPFAETRTG